MSDDVEIIADRGRPRAFTLRVGGTDQSYVDLDDPTRLDFDYMQRMADVLDTWAPQGEPLRVVHIGGAALSMPRYVAATRPRSAQTVLEPAAHITQLVRREMPLPRNSGIKVRDVAGRAGVAALRDGFTQVIIVDAFDGSRVPGDLGTVDFFTEARRVLEPGGLLLMNIADKAPFGYARRVVGGAQAVFGHVMLSAEPATLKGRRFGNLLLVACSEPIDATGLARTAASSPFPYRIVQSHDVARHFGVGQPFTDDDAEMSPLPPGGAAFFK